MFTPSYAMGPEQFAPEHRLKRINEELKHLWHTGPAELQIEALWWREHLQHIIYTRSVRRADPDLAYLVAQWERAHNRWEEAVDLAHEQWEIDFWQAEAEGWADDIWLETEARRGRF